MTKLFRIDPTFTVGPKGPPTIGYMVADATPPARGQANVGGETVSVRLCGISKYRAGDAVNVVMKDSGAWAIKRSGDYYQSRVAVPIERWVPPAKASKAVLHMLKKARRVRLYEIVDVDGASDEIMSGVVTAIMNGVSMKMPVVYAGDASVCYGGINLAMAINDGAQYEVVSGTDLLSLMVQSDRADADNPDISGVAYEWDISAPGTPTIVVNLEWGTPPFTLVVSLPEFTPEYTGGGEDLSFHDAASYQYTGPMPADGESYAYTISISATDRTGATRSVSGTATITNSSGGG